MRKSVSGKMEPSRRTSGVGVVSERKARVWSWLVVVIALSGASLLSARDPWTAPESDAQKENPVRASKDAITRGKELYLDRCADCHGKKGRGDGPGAADLECHPPDFSKPQVSQQSDGALFWKISAGRKPMPGYGRKLSEEQRWQVVAYLRSMSGK